MDSDSCDLSPQARAFSTVLTAFIGSIVNGVTSGGMVAFMTGWISWLAVLRVLSGALFGLYQAFSSKYTILEQASRGPPADEEVPEERGVMLRHLSQEAVSKETSDAQETPGSSYPVKKLNGRITRDVTVLGWIGWVYTAVYSPIVQALWLAANWTHASGALKIVRALSISITALSLTIDTKKRYASKLSDTRYLGNPAGVAFKLVNGFSAFGMGTMCATLLIKGAIDASLPWYVIMVYCFFAVVWAAFSYQICPVQDGAIRGYGLLGDILMGAFAGLFLAAPAFALMQWAQAPTLGSDGFSSPDSGPSSLHGYLSCDSVAVWQKFVAVFP
ncbi:hypothetical protein JMJ35_008747 [Cladonia borealis]|uniref:Uncharacterized protein n=1 Tax=Cladonia borealis TaxID=184061 RepID=A0AA39QU70_9LECA|nr:hypothetical protein JMJ35_008747 [Cladonia borealis]